MSASLATYDLSLCTDKELNQLEKLPTFKAYVLDFRANRAVIMADRIANAKTATYTLDTFGGRSFSYAELLMLATINEKKWYDMPENNPIQAINEEIAETLRGIQSREANALKLAIAEAVA